MTIHDLVDTPDILNDKTVSISMSNTVFYAGLTMIGTYPMAGMIEFKKPDGSIVVLREKDISVIEIWP